MVKWYYGENNHNYWFDDNAKEESLVMEIKLKFGLKNK